MRRLTYYSGILTLVFVLILLGCKKDPEPNLIQDKLNEIQGTYLISAVTLDGNDVSADYAGMSITLTTSKSYSTSGGDYNPVWPANGTFLFKNEASEPPVLTSFIRNDGIEVAYTLSGTTMTFTLNMPDTGGRITGLGGDFVFVGSK